MIRGWQSPKESEKNPKESKTVQRSPKRWKEFSFLYSICSELKYLNSANFFGDSILNDRQKPRWICHATSNSFHGCRVETNNVMSEKICWMFYHSGAPNWPNWGSAEPNLYRTGRNKIRPKPKPCRSGQNEIYPNSNIRPNHRSLIMQSRNTFSNEYSTQYHVEYSLENEFMDDTFSSKIYIIQ